MDWPLGWRDRVAQHQAAVGPTLGMHVRQHGMQHDSIAVDVRQDGQAHRTSIASGPGAV
jgi:hypothetical protein